MHCEFVQALYTRGTSHVDVRPLNLAKWLPIRPTHRPTP